MTPEHIKARSVHLPPPRSGARTALKDGAAKGAGGETVDSDMQICVFYSSETSLAYHISPFCSNLHLDTEKALQKAPTTLVFKKKKILPASIGRNLLSEPPAGKPQ